VIKGGVVEGKLLGPDDVRKLADLESREVLLSRIAGGMQGVLAQAISLISAPLSQAARLFSALQSAAEENPSLIAGPGEPADDVGESSKADLAAPVDGEVATDAAPAAPSAAGPAADTEQSPSAEAAPADDGLTTEAAPAADDGLTTEAAPAADDGLTTDAAPAADQLTIDAAPAADQLTTDAAPAAAETSAADAVEDK
jgi:hypothetical protein